MSNEPDTPNSDHPNPPDLDASTDHSPSAQPLSEETRRLLFSLCEKLSEDLFAAPDPGPEAQKWLKEATRPQLCGLLRAVLHRLA
ncbi:MAG: hypothetical protein AAGA92_07680 [Planctomycetota bacterium]